MTKLKTKKSKITINKKNQFPQSITLSLASAKDLSVVIRFTLASWTILLAS